MKTGIGRRVFVGSVVAGLPLLASASSRVGAQSSPGSAHTHVDGPVSDPLLDHIARQLAVIHNAMRRQPRGEQMRAFAAQLRTLAVYGRQSDLDGAVRSAINTLVERDGRDAVLYHEPDLARVRADLKSYGAQPDERVLTAPVTLDYAARSAALNGLLQSGMSIRWERIATNLERLAPAIDQRMATIIRVGQVENHDPAYWEGYCTELWNQYKETQFLAAPICASAALPIIGAAFAPLCAAYQLAATFLAIVYAGYCLNAR